MPTVTLNDVEVFQFESRPYVKDGQTRQARSLLGRYKGKMFMFSIARDAKDEDLKAMENQTVDLDLEMTTFGKELDPSFSVIGPAN